MITSELTLLESLIHPLRGGASSLCAEYERTLLASELRLIPVTQPILREAARLRAHTPGLRTPDALHAATAFLSNCSLFFTNDTGFRRIPELPLTLLSEVVAPKADSG